MFRGSTAEESVQEKNFQKVKNSLENNTSKDCTYHFVPYKYEMKL